MQRSFKSIIGIKPQEITRICQLKEILKLAFSHICLKKAKLSVESLLEYWQVLHQWEEEIQSLKSGLKEYIHEFEGWSSVYNTTRESSPSPSQQS